MLNTSSDKSQLNQDHSRINEEDDSLMMTIEYLRARLLSERSISKVAKERTDDLVKRVKELEEQLKVVTFQRKRAEKAALDVVSYLDSLGIGDNLEVYECDSDEDESECESNMDNSDTAKDDKKFESFENKGNDKESSGSEHECTTPLSGRSLSWKGRKESTRLLDVKLLSSSLRSRSGLAQLHSSPRNRLGKSCRQIRRRELRSTDVKLMHAGKSDTQDSNFKEGPNHCQDCLDIQNGKLKRSPERFIERGSKKDEVPHSSQAEAQDCDAGSSTHERECTGEMERALQHQAQLIRSYEAQEKAQRDWEEKYRDNNDSCEPGSHSDVTEEREENKAVVSRPVEVDGQDDKTPMETNARGEKRSMAQFNSFKITPDADLGSSGNQKLSEKPSTSADFAFCVVDNSKSSEHAGHSDSTNGGSAFNQSQPPQNLNTTRTLVPHREPAKLGSVLEALQEAKQMIKQHMNSSAETRESVGKSIEAADPRNRDSDWLKLPVGCPGLFRVPTELDGQISNQKSFPSLNYTSEPSTSNYIARTVGNFYVSKPMDPPLDIASGLFVSNSVFKPEFETSNRQPRSDFFPHRSSDQMQSQFQGNEAGRPIFGYPSFQNFEFNPNGYK